MTLLPRTLTPYITLVLLLTGCSESAEQSTCTAQELSDGSLALQCDDDPAVVIKGGPGTPGTDGSSGTVTLADLEFLSPGNKGCIAGGQEIHLGQDTDGDARLDSDERNQSFVICSGAPGDGGFASVEVTTLPEGSDECSEGGTSLKVWDDLNENQLLDNQEPVLQQFEVCNGRDGINGTVPDLKIEPLAQGDATCSQGGRTVSTVDDDGNETASFSLCKGAPGTAGTDGQDLISPNLAVTPEPSGSNCPFGGTKLVLSMTTHYVCNVGQFTSLSSGYDHSCARADDSTLWCWGNNQSGQLTGQTSPLTSKSDLAAVVNDIAGVAQVSAGSAHTCMVQTTGVARCWGLDDGRLGINNTPSNMPNAPQNISTSGLMSNVTQISSGTTSTCALLQSGEVWCWGKDESGKLGSPGLDSNLPVQVVDDTNTPLTKMRSVAVGESHACAVARDGGVRCWGKNDQGQLGDGTVIDRDVAVEVAVIDDAKSVSVNRLGTCALNFAGEVWCWGAPDDGRLGNGTANTPQLQPTQVAGLEQVIQLDSREDHTCALGRDGEVSCWGKNSEGQLGNGMKTPSSSRPIKVLNLAGTVASVATGRGHTCALLASGSAQCWGSGSLGQLGNDTAQESLSPVFVKLP